MSNKHIFESAEELVLTSLRGTVAQIQRCDCDSRSAGFTACLWFHTMTISPLTEPLSAAQTCTQQDSLFRTHINVHTRRHYLRRWWWS